MSDEEIDEVVSFETIEEAIAVAMPDVGDGGIVSIHAADCELNEEDEDSCTCEPLTLTVGAKE